MSIDRNDWKFVLIKIDEVLLTTATHIRVRINHRFPWVPKSLIENREWEAEMKIEIPEWFVRSEGLSSFKI